ncbi:NH(3)-dependent NAD(+) synthetase [Desulforamulus reducens MI-1]|uniref:Glutamine-dependent NAD(+) synthetase n=1 Tax=Desulforamulus reducens (strain ATCC BAA-1160 / DSM 100696 / MI-1) TaxID=349161 RepID=A4J4I7_DESRM|nr:NAD(+) synthase [Desulforamulus reducens]ABO49990.1 NH(3)-dependent NAD(+) synthetase [Desulforamulus reducens MI-1]
MKLKIMIGQMEVIPGHPDQNTNTMLEMIGQAREARADMVVFPEMCIPGYLLGDTWEQQSFLRDCEEYGREIVAASQGLTVLFGNVGIDWDKKGDDGRVRKYNAFFVAQNGKLLGRENFPYSFRIKTLQPNYREFDDERHFYSLRKLAQEYGKSPEELLSPVYVNIGGQKLALGCLLCEDGWSEDFYVTKPVTALKEKGPIDLFINISSSPFTVGKNQKRNRIFSRQAQEAAVPLIYVNNVGIQNNGKTIYAFDGSSTVYAKNGEVINYCSEPFSQSAEIFELHLNSDGSPSTAGKLIDNQETISVYQALNYGVRQFLSSIGMKKVVIGISGGIDSAVSAALYADAIGPENLLLVNMPSKFNSQTTKNLARELAENLRCFYTVLPIQKSVDYTLKQIESTPIINAASGDRIQLKISSFMAENIQARDRSSRILAAVAAAFGGGFTCNANKAETTVGYSTLYGDQAGFLAAIADLWKYQVYDLARYLNQQVYHREVIPQGIIDIVPSAELSFDQAVDDGKGDPLVYPYHDYLFRAFVQWWDKATPEDILTWYGDGNLEEKLGCAPGLVKKIFPSAKEFISDLERWWKQFTGIGVAKRIQAPPILAVSRRAFGFDHREAQNGVYFTRKYKQLKEQLLS